MLNLKPRFNFNRSASKLYYILITSICLIFTNISLGQLDLENCFCVEEACGELNASFSPVGGPSFCEGDSIQLNNESDNGFDFFIIDWKDGIVDTVRNYESVFHVYNLLSEDESCTGSRIPFNVCFIGVKECAEGISCQSGALSFAIRYKPIANFSVPGQVCVETEFSPIDSSCNATDYFWDFGDGVTSEETIPTHSYPSGGTETVTLRVENQCGEDEKQRSIQVVDPPEVEFTFDSEPDDQCEGAVITFSTVLNAGTFLNWNFPPIDTNRWCFTDTSTNQFTRNFSILFKDAGIYPFDATGSNVCEEDFTVTDTIEIYEEAFVTPRPDLKECESVTLSPNDLFVYTGTITNYEWQFLNLDGSIRETIPEESFAPREFTTSTTVVLNVESPCGDKTAQIDIEIIDIDIALGDNPARICQSDDTYQLLAEPEGGIWTGNGSEANAAVTSTGEIDLTQLQTGQTYSFTYSVAEDICNQTSDPVEIEIIPPMGLQLLTPSVCKPEQINMSNFVTYTGEITDYIWVFNGATVSEQFPMFDLIAGNNTIQVTIEGDCDTITRSTSLFVAEDFEIEVESVPNTICLSDSTFQLQATPEGGQWVGIGVASNAVTTNGEVDLEQLGEGTFSFEYSIGQGDCRKTSMISLRTIPGTPANIETAIVCTNSAPTQLQVDISGGTWSGEGVSPNGLFDPTGLATDQNYTVFYAFTDENGCSVISEGQVRVDALPVIQLDPTTDLCLSGFDVDLNTVLNYGVSPAGGRTTWTGTGISDPSGTFNAGALAEGRYEVTVTYSLEDCVVEQTATLNVAQASTLSISQDTTICVNESTLQLEASLAGGEWEGVGINPATGEINLSDAGTGGRTQTYSYTYQAGTSCEQRQSVQVEILDPGEINVRLRSVSPACNSLELNTSTLGIIEYTNVTAITNYKWFINTDSVSSEAFPTFNFDPGVYTLRVEVEGTCNTPEFDEIEILVQKDTALVIDPIDNPICSGSTPITLTANAAGGTWRSDRDDIIDPTTGLIDPALVNAGEYFITYQFEDGACTSVSPPIRLEIVTSDVATIQQEFVCTDSEPTTLTVDRAGGFWYGDFVRADGVFNPQGLATNTDYPVFYEFIDDNGCQVIAEGIVTVDALPVLNFADKIDLCLSDIDVNLVEELGFTATPDDGELAWSGDNVSATGLFNASGLDVGTYQVYIEYKRRDCTVLDTATIEIRQEEALILPEDREICIEEDTLTLLPNLQGGVWSGDGVDAVTGLIDLTTGSGGRTITYTYTYQEGTNCAQAGTVDVSILDLGDIDVTLAIVEDACDQLTLNTADIVDFVGENIITNYEWRYNDTIRSTDPTPTFTFDPISTELQVIISGQCAAPVEASIPIFVQKDTVITIDPIVNPICKNLMPIQLGSNVAGGTWRSDPADIIEANSGRIDLDVVPAGDYIIFYDFLNGACDSQSDPFPITVVDTATATIAGDTLCTDSEAVQLLVDVEGGKWQAQLPNLDSTGQFNPNGLATDQVYTVYYEFVDENNCVVTEQGAVLVESLPIQMYKPTIELCLANFDVDLPTALEYTVDKIEGQTRWSGPGVINENGVFNSDGLTPGTYTILIDYERNDCMIRDTATIIVIEPEPLVLSPDESVCISATTFQLEANLAGGIWEGEGIDSETGLIDLSVGVGGNTFEYTYSFQMGTTCQQMGAVNIEIIDLNDDLSAGEDTEICEGPTELILEGQMPDNGIWSGESIDSITGRIDLTQLDKDENYTYTYTIESELVEGCTFSKTRNFIIHSNPVAAFSVDGVFCEDETFQMINQTTNAVEYLWDFGDGTDSEASNPTHTYTETGTYTLSLLATSEFGCTNAIDTTLFIAAPPVVAFDLLEKEGCAPFEVQVDNQSFGFDITQTWCIDGKTYNGAALMDVILDSVTVDSTFLIELKVSNFCDSIAVTDSVLVRPYPIVSFGIKQEELCSPSLVEFSNTTIGDPDSFFWRDGRGDTSTLEVLPSRYYTTTDSTISTYDVILSATNECGTRYDTTTITVIPPDIQAFIEERDTIVGCQPMALNVESFSTTGAKVSWLVLDEMGNEVLGNNGSILNDTLLEAGFYTIILTAAQCGMAFDTSYARVLPLPEVAFGFSRPYVCENDTIQFFNESANTNALIWDFGDGNGATEPSPIHRFENAGFYTIRLSGTSLQNQCEATVVKEFEVKANPMPSFTPSVTSGCTPLEIEFTNNSTGTTTLTYEWQFNDDCGEGASTETNPTYTFNCPGQYTATLNVFDDFQCAATTQVDNIFVFDLPAADFEFEDRKYCLGYDTIFLNNLSSEDAIRSVWTIAGTTIEQNNPFYLPTAAGELEIELQVFNRNDCSDTIRKTVNILPSAEANFTTDVDAGCEDLTIQFTNTSQFADNYIWEYGEENSSNLENPSHTYTDAGTYSAQLIASSLNGCPSDTFSLPIEVYPKPIADFRFTLDGECGAPKPVAFENLSIGQQTNNWSFGDGQFSTSTNPEHIFQAAGLYETYLAIENQFGCVDTITKAVDIWGQPIADFELSVDEGCQDLAVTFENLSSQSLSYLWNIESFPTTQETAPTVLFIAIGQYDVELIAIYNQFCQDTLRFENAITVYETPIPDFNYQTDFDDKVLGEVQFENLSIKADSYFWNFGDSITSTVTDPLHIYNRNRTLEVTLTAFNNNDGLFLCEAAITKDVNPEWITTFFAPSAFAPDYNGSGVDVFKPVGIGMIDYEISVYSPWGNLVWYSEELEDGQPSGAWNGRLQNTGQLLQQGAYTWLAIIKYEDGNTVNKKGTVTLIR